MQNKKECGLLRSPEFHEDKKQKSRQSEREEDVLMAEDPLDYHAISELPRIQTLLWRLNK